MPFSMTWNGPESKWSIYFRKANPIRRSSNLLRSPKLPASTDEIGPISASEPFFDLPHSAGGCLFPAAAALPGQLNLSSASGDQCKPPILEVHAGPTKESHNRQHHPWSLSSGLLPRSADTTR